MKKISLFIILIFVTVVAVNIQTVASSAPSHITPQDSIYFLMTDRFNDGDLSNNQNVHKKDLSAYHGGDFQGIIDKLDYINDLGFTAIWISPVVKNQVRGYHGYWATDFYQTNENFGSLAKLKELVEKAHARGIKVIVDLVVNHVSGMHPWLADPKYENWFHHNGSITNWNDDREVEEKSLQNLPDLDQSNPEVKKYLIDMAKWWINETGIDGYRLDTVRHVSKDFWREFTSEIKKEFPHFYFLGEVFDGRSSYVGSYQAAGIDGMLDFPLYYALTDVFKEGQSAVRLKSMIEECQNTYQNSVMMGTFLDNHDVPRFVNQIYDFPEERLKQALTFVMTYTGIPVIYYGTEIGMDGGADPENRGDMDWSVKSPLTGFIKRLNEVRRSNKALVYGNFQIIEAKDDYFCYARQFEENTVIAVFNLSNDKKQFQLSLTKAYQNKQGVLNEQIGKKQYQFTNGTVKIKMAPRGVYLFTVDGHKS